MINKYVSCEDCTYQEFCHQFDAFFGCSNGVSISNLRNAENVVPLTDNSIEMKQE